MKKIMMKRRKNIFKIEIEEEEKTKNIFNYKNKRIEEINNNIDRGKNNIKSNGVNPSLLGKSFINYRNDQFSNNAYKTPLFNNFKKIIRTLLIIILIEIK